VTRSANVKNPYVRRRNTNFGIPNVNRGTELRRNAPREDDAAPITPIPFRFHHISGTFSGKTFSPKTVSNAMSILSNDCKGSRHRSMPSSARPIPQALDYGDTITSTIKPKRIPGKGNGEKISLADLDAMHGPLPDRSEQGLLRCGVSQIVLQVTSVNSSKLYFDTNGLPSFFQSALGHRTSPGDDSGIGANDVYSSLLEQGCDKTLLSKKWITNHYRWIVWKLSAMERRFPHVLAGRYCTYGNVLNQIKKRYERELIEVKRPAIRQILNKDAAASRLMVLCVSQILPNYGKNPNSTTKINGKNNAAASSSSIYNQVKIELTDGWYSIPAVLDTSLSSFVTNGKIRIGQKVAISGAVLHGCEDGIDPLDESYSSLSRNCPVALGLSANSTRMAKWQCKLGFCHSPAGSFVCRSLSSVIPGGGSVQLMDLVICRRFPLLYLQSSGEGGGSNRTILTEAQEGRARKSHEDRRQRVIEKEVDRAERECMIEVEDLAPTVWKRMMAHADPLEFYQKLDSSDQKLVEDWKDRRIEVLRDLQQKSVDCALENESSMTRNTIPFVKFLVKAFQTGQKHSSTDKNNEDISGILTIWRPSEEQNNILKEGTAVRLKNVSVKSALHSGKLQLSATNKTPIHVLPQRWNSLLHSGYKPRSFVSLVKLHVLSKKRKFSEVDFVGVRICAVQVHRKEHTDLPISQVYLTDKSGLVLRLEREFEEDERPAIRAAPWNTSNNDYEDSQTFAFRDVRLLPFDDVENCAVATWTHSSIQLQGNKERLHSLRSWSKSISGIAACAKVKNALNVGVALSGRLPSDLAIGIGYILHLSEGCTDGFEVNCPTFVPLTMVVDCGNTAITAQLPIHLLDEVLRLCDVSCTVTELQLTIETANCSDTINAIGGQVCESGTLFHFLMRRRGNTFTYRNGEELFEVVRVKKADIGSLSNLYLEHNFGKEDVY